MNKKTNWKVGNSTVRNPHKVMEAFNIYSQNINNGIFDISNFVNKLNESSKFNLKSKSNKVHGNFIRSMFKELGLITNNNNLDIITPIGYEFLNKKSDINKIYLKQLSKFQFKNGNTIIKPFVIFLTIFNSLLKKGITDISKIEFELFIMTCMDINDCDKNISDLISFRNNLEHSTSINKKQYEQLFKEDFIYKINKEFIEEKQSILKTIFSQHDISFIKNNDFLLDVAVSTQKGIRSKKAKDLKQEIITSYEQTGDTITSCLILKKYFCNIKGKNLSSDSQITLKYFVATDLFHFNSKKICIDTRYRIILSYILNKYAKVEFNKEKHISAFCFNRDIKLSNRVMRVEVQNYLVDLISHTKNTSIAFILPFLMYMKFNKLETKES